MANGACSKNASGDGVKLVDVAAIAAGFRAAYMKNPGSTRTPVGPVDALEILENVSTAPRLTQLEALGIGKIEVMPSRSLYIKRVFTTCHGRASRLISGVRGGRMLVLPPHGPANIC